MAANALRIASPPQQNKHDKRMEDGWQEQDFSNPSIRRKTLGNWCRAVSSRDQVVHKSAMAESSGTTGGYLVPIQLVLGVDAYLLERSLFMQRGFVIPMTTEECNVGTVDLTAAHATGASPLFGGMKMSAVQEGAAIGESEPSFAQDKLVARTHSNLVTVSNDMVNDGGATLGTYLENIFSRLLLYTIEHDCFLGKGVEGNLGVVNAPGTAAVNRQTPGTVTTQDLGGMVASLLPASFVNAVWACSGTAISKIVQLAQFVVNAGPSQQNLAGHLMGRPLYVTENLPAVGTPGDVLLFDPSLYLLGIRQLEVASSDQVQFQANQTVFRLILRMDGLPLVNNTFKLQDGSTTVGAYVALN